MAEQTPPVEPKKHSNTKQYLTIALILLLFGMGISMVYKSFAPAKEVVTENIQDTAANDVLDENEPEDQTLNDIIDKQDVNFDDDEEDLATKGSDNSSVETIDKPEPATKRTSPSTIQNHATTVLADRSDAPKKLSKYMVITGSFGSITNARKRLEQTIIAGYRDAEIVQFDNSKYHTVCAVRTDHESTARAAVQKLRKKKIDAILHTVKAKEENLR